MLSDILPTARIFHPMVVWIKERYSFVHKKSSRVSATRSPNPMTGSTMLGMECVSVFATGIKVQKNKRFTMVTYLSTLLTFVVALIISTVIIYYIAKWFGAKDCLTTALLAALIGTAVYTIFFSVLGQGLIAAFIAGIVWLLALQKLYTIGWLKSLLIAVVVWIVTSIVGWFLPTLTGPL